MSTKKSGYDILKEKVAKLEKERDELQKDLDFALARGKETRNNLIAERDEWKAKWQQADAAKQDAVDRYNHKQRDYEDVMSSFKRDELKIAFLLDHCPFWVRRRYERQFGKGGKG